MRTLRSYVGLPLLLAACTGGSGCSSDAQPPPDLAKQLEADTRTPWAVWRDPASHEVRFLSPSVPAGIEGATPEEKARRFFAKYRDALHATDDPQDLRLADTTVDDDGSVHLRFTHFLPGTSAEVFEAATTVHFTAAGLLLWLQPGFREDLAGLPTTAKVAVADATTAATNELRATCGPLSTSMVIEHVDLGVNAHEDSRAALAYRVRTTGASARCLAVDVIVDATTSAILATSSRASAFWDTAPGARFYLLGDKSDKKTIDVNPHFHISGPKTYSLDSEVSPTVYTFDTVGAAGVKTFEQATLGSWDTVGPYKGTAVSAHFHGYHALRFFKEAKLRSSNNDVTILVHNFAFTDNGTNARCINGTVYLGDGDVLAGGNTMPGAAAFDIVTHEITHAITDKTSKLAYRDESGALNESFSDVMGASAEQWFNETSDPAKNVIIGEGWTKDGSGVRDMVNPRAHHDPDHKKDRIYCKDGEAPSDGNDNCYLHSNSGIANRAFTLMTLGGTHATSKITIANGIGWKAARELWYTTLTNLRPQATFWDAALAQIAVAATKGPETLQTVACAWQAVGGIEFGLGFNIDPRLIGVACQIASDPAKAVDPPKATPGSSSVTGEPKCVGHENSAVCDDAAPSSAYVCKNGGLVGVTLCADLAAQCKRASASDPTATIGADGALVCE
jgi:Zn-dependent metalloprotease